MAESVIAVTEGSGKNLHSFDRTVSSVLVQDQFVLPGEYPLATYAVVAESVSTATANDHILQIMAGSALNVRIRRIRIEQSANATAAATAAFQILRLNTAGTGGTAITPTKYETSDAAAGATAMTLPTAKGTEGSGVLMSTVLALRQAVSTTATTPDDFFEWTQHPGAKALVIAAGTSNGICVKSLNARAGATITVNIEFVESSY